MWAKNKQKLPLADRQGFTIVELLIVIVVIGILAAITVVAYSGVQQKASNTQRITAAKDWVKIITAYTSSTGLYPATTFSNHTCLGTGNPTDFDANADEDCFGTGNIKHPSVSINTAYRTIGTLPKFPADKLSSTSGIGTTAGISLRALDTLDPGTANEKLAYPFLYFWLKGTNQDCILRPVAALVAGGYTTGTGTNSIADEGGLTRCMILLPDRYNL